MCDTVENFGFVGSKECIFQEDPNQMNEEANERILEMIAWEKHY